jgi:hypothetical protein
METGSPTASLNARSTDRPSPGTSSADIIADGLATDQEEKPRFPPQAGAVAAVRKLGGADFGSFQSHLQRNAS